MDVTIHGVREEVVDTFTARVNKNPSLNYFYNNDYPSYFHLYGPLMIFKYLCKRYFAISRMWIRDRLGIQKLSPVDKDDVAKRICGAITQGVADYFLSENDTFWLTEEEWLPVLVLYPGNQFSKPKLIDHIESLYGDKDIRMNSQEKRLIADEIRRQASSYTLLAEDLTFFENEKSIFVTLKKH